MARIFVIGGFAESLINFRGPLLKEMVARGYEVFACAPESSVNITSALSDMGVTYYPLPFERTGMNPFQDVRFLIKLIAVLRQIQPDIFLAYTIKPVIYGSIAAKLSGVPEIYSMITGLGYSFSGGSLKSRIIGRLATMLYRLGLSFNKNIFFQNPDDLALFFERRIFRTREKAVLINGSGVDVMTFIPVSMPSVISFLLVARLLRDKGVYEYALAARQIRQKYPDVKFKLVGWLDPNPHAIDENDLTAWQAAGDIEFLGKLDDVRPAIAECSVYVLPSYREGTPRTVLEAMAMGRPIITTNAPGCRETVTHECNGLLIPVRNIERLVAAMERFIVDPDLSNKMGKKSRKIAEEKYDVRKVNAKILQTMGVGK